MVVALRSRASVRKRDSLGTDLRTQSGKYVGARGGVPCAAARMLREMGGAGVVTIARATNTAAVWDRGEPQLQIPRGQHVRGQARKRGWRPLRRDRDAARR